jgi:hypothetical protein
VKLYLINDDGSDTYVAAESYSAAVKQWAAHWERIDEEPEHITLLCAELVLQ